MRDLKIVRQTFQNDVAFPNIYDVPLHLLDAGLYLTPPFLDPGNEYNGAILRVDKRFPTSGSTLSCHLMQDFCNMMTSSLTTLARRIKPVLSISGGYRRT